jgi:adenylosuccinate synthase
MPKKPKKVSKKVTEEHLAAIKEAAENGRIEMASQSEIDTIPVDYLTDFFTNILEMSFWDCLITDESSLYDFPEEAEVYAERIKKSYGLDIDLNSKLHIYDIVKQIKKSYK